MKQFKNYEAAKAEAQASGMGHLPVGAYVCKVMNVRYTEASGNQINDRIDVQFDIDEGDQKGFFKKQYEANTADSKKWKGKVSVYVPSDDGSEADSWTKKTFANWTDSFEKSNAGYLWDWDENKWKGKLIGIVFGETGTVINGKEVKYTEARFPVAVEKVRSGSAPAAKFKTKNGYTGTQVATSSTGSADAAFMDVSLPNTEEDIPF